METKPTIVHLTSAHPRYDTRIFVKQCRSLIRQGFRVFLVVADGKGNEERDGVSILDVGKGVGRLYRMFRTARKVYSCGLSLNADLYHLHDPELIPYGFLLKNKGFKVVFDSHEDVESQLLSKPYLNPMLLHIISKIYAAFERNLCSRFDGVVAATPFIRDKFSRIASRVVDVNNFPILGELDSEVPWGQKSREVCYVGGMSSVRGIRNIVRACEYLKSGAKLNLAGNFSEAALESEVKEYPGWSRVNNLGFLDREGVREVLGRSIAGLVTLHRTVNYMDALPVKMFEYMAAGMPVIASDIPLWKSIINENECGLCVDPLDSNEIAEKIDYLVNNQSVAQAMGENGRRAVMQKYNWGVEERKLFDFYDSILCS